MASSIIKQSRCMAIIVKEWCGVRRDFIVCQPRVSCWAPGGRPAMPRSTSSARMCAAYRRWPHVYITRRCLQVRNFVISSIFFAFYLFFDLRFTFLTYSYRAQMAIHYVIIYYVLYYEQSESITGTYLYL